MSVCFNADGTRILALGRRQPATLYSLHSPVKLFEFDHPGNKKLHTKEISFNQTVGQRRVLILSESTE